MSLLSSENPEISTIQTDPLANLEATEATQYAEPVVAVTSYETPVESINAEDPLESFCPTTASSSIQSIASETLSHIRENCKILGHYLAVSSVVFVLLLVAANFSAYFSIAWNYISPEGLKTSSLELSEALSKSKITVFASENNTGSESEEGKSETAEVLKKKLENDNIVIKENVLSPKKLVPTVSNLSVSLDIVPYENRIVIPKIGKNIPLVDVDNSQGFDFDHMENIFMRELEKGIVRYPGTPTPGNNGNVFIFGHSSNYPWMQGDYNQVFALLDNLEFGDEIIVYYNQKKYTYVIREKKVVRPGDVKVLSRDESKKELSLMTCWPVGTTLKRMIVFSELKEVTPNK